MVGCGKCKVRVKKTHDHIRKYKQKARNTSKKYSHCSCKTRNCTLQNIENHRKENTS